MEITGADYVYLTNTAPQSVEEIFLTRIGLIWPSPLIETYDRTDDHIELFLARDAALIKFHEKHGFSLNDSGEGCFMFCARRFHAFESDAAISLIVKPRKLRNTDPYNMKLLLKDRWEYTLVLPTPLEESEFSKKINNILIHSIRSAAFKFTQTSSSNILRFPDIHYGNDEILDYLYEISNRLNLQEIPGWTLEVNLAFPRVTG